MKHANIRWLIAAAIGLFVLIAAACAAGGSSNEGDATGEIDGTTSTGRDEAQAGEPAGVASYDSFTSPDSNGAAPPSGNQLDDLLSRKIVQNTSVDIKVEEVGRNFQDIIRVAQVNQGFVASSSFSNVDGQQVADLTVRVPADRYQAVLQEIRGMGEVVTEGSDSSDVTEEYTDLQARLRTLEATEQRYLELLAQANNVNDILTVQDRLDVVRGEIEQVQGRINLLDNLTDLATITVHLRPAVVAVGGGGSGGISGAAERAWESSLDSLRGIATAAIVVVAYSWWLVPPLAGIAFGTRWLLRRPRPLSTPSA